MSSTARSYAVSADEPRSYDPVYKLFHWTIVVLLIGQLLTKLIQPGAVSEDTLNAWHVSIGPTILVLTLLRLAWRLTHRPPPPPRDLAPALQALARATHWGFYVLLIVLPLLGWISASAYGVRPYLLGVVPLPLIAPEDKALAETVGRMHGVLALVLLALVALHVAGAMFHALVKRDGVIQRMLPFGRPGAP